MRKHIKNLDTFLSYTDHHSSKAKEIRRLILDSILYQIVDLEGKTNFPLDRISCVLISK